MGVLDGKVAFVTGAARGQGRSHAVRLAQEGADIIAIDLCKQVASVPYAMSAPADLDETRRQIEALDRRAVISEADVRDTLGLGAALNEGVAQLGRLDIVVANAGIVSFGGNEHRTPGADSQGADHLSDEQWQDMIDINLTGVYKTVRASIPHLRARPGEGGSIVMTSSVAGLVGLQGVSHYVAAKHGVIGLMRSLANELGPYQIRVNAVLPGSVNTDMVHNEVVYKRFRPDLDHPTREDTREMFARDNPMHVAWVDPVDISNAVLWLVSDSGRYVSGATIPIDAGRIGRP